MHTIQPLDLLVMWERGQVCHPIDRSALLCAWGRPDIPPDASPDLPLGEVTACLLRMRSAWFGDRVRVHADCERCGERLELTVYLSDLLQQGAECGYSSDVTAAGLRCRLPCLRDLAAVAQEHDSGRAARQLATRCLLEPPCELDSVLTDAALHEISDALERADPNADLAFEIRCGECGHLGSAQLDPGEMLWDEIDVRARSLLAEVHVLARAYGWTEREILELSPQRRASYLSMVSA